MDFFWHFFFGVDAMSMNLFVQEGMSVRTRADCHTSVSVCLFCNMNLDADVQIPAPEFEKSFFHPTSSDPFLFWRIAVFWVVKAETSYLSLPLSTSLPLV